MKPETKEKIQNAILATILGAIIPVAIGFGGGFWVTRQTAEQMSNSSVVAAKIKICAAQFASAGNYQERLKEFKLMDYTARGRFMDTGGWSKMPGETKASDAVKEGCAKEIEALLQN
jgi:hypothetical protein